MKGRSDNPHGAQQLPHKGHVVQVPVNIQKAITCMAWSPNGQQVALAAHNSPDIDVWQAGGPGGAPWQLLATLKGHSMAVSGLDWDHPEGLLASCSHDRTANVWHQGTRPPEGVGSLVAAAPGWSRQLVETGLTRGCTCVRWSPLNQYKMAVGSAASLAVVTYDAANGYWSSRRVARAGSSGSVTCVAWHPHTHLLAAGSTDGCVRLFHGECTGKDTTPTLPHHLVGQTKFGQLLAVVSPISAGWVHALAWTPDGQQLLSSSHSSQLHVCELDSMLQSSGGQAGPATGASAVGFPLEPPCVEQQQQQQPRQPQPQPQPPAESIQLPGCPLNTLLVLQPDRALGAGWDGLLLMFSRCTQAHHSTTTAAGSSCAGGYGSSRGGLDDHHTPRQQGPSYGSWSLQHVLGQFVPGQPALAAPAQLLPQALSSQGLCQQLRSSLTVSSSNHSAPAAAGGGDAGAQAMAQTAAHAKLLEDWEAVMQGTMPAHDACVTSLACLQPPSAQQRTQHADDIALSPSRLHDQGSLHGQEPAPHRPTTWCSCGLDGRLILWQMS